MALGRFGATRDDPRRSREASRGASELARGLPRRSRSVPKAPESTPRRPGEASGPLFRTTFSQSVSQEAPAAISFEFWVVRGSSEACLTAQAQCFVRVGRFSSERPVDRQIERKATPERPQDGPRSRQNARKSVQANEAGEAPQEGFPGDPPGGYPWGVPSQRPPGDPGDQLATRRQLNRGCRVLKL